MYSARDGHVVKHWYDAKIHPLHVAGRGNSGSEGIKKCVRDQFIQSVCGWGVVGMASPFDRRVTCVQWHPTHHRVLAFASHKGDAILWNIDSSQKYFMSGEHPHQLYEYGSITNMVFSTSDPSCVYVTSVRGAFTLRDFEGKHSELYYKCSDWRYWWTSLAISTSRSMMFIGGNTGRAMVFDTAGNKVLEFSHLHKGKIQCAQFCPSCDHYLVTGSNDRTACLWDIRMFEEDRPPINIMSHDSPVTAAHFDPIDGTRLLTTAQKDTIRLYDSCSCSDPSILMTHDHRHFQHMTDITATWHPYHSDLCVIGRYAPKFSQDKTRCVDLIDLKKQTIVGRFYDPSASQIITVNKFDQFGEYLASGMGYRALLWRCNTEAESMPTKKLGSMVNGRGLLPSQPFNARERDNNRKKRKNDDTDDIERLKKKVCSKKL